LPSPAPLFPSIPNPFLFMSLQSQLQMFMFHLNTANQAQVPLSEKFYKKRRAPGEDRELKKSHLLDSDGLLDNMGDVIIPSTDKEGWCRNKKYIEKTDEGFMCIVCKKMYGRYNSVSYHVTIYHRNPPIKCDLPGCQFTTREARYIHFHKYYRHGVALPESIDQGSRRCPHCRHVSKSPAMLEKHIRRHQIVENARWEYSSLNSVATAE
uniref:C2H2-type domain-containing protein n=1 Tax=Angiostrongylus cantonensis TaxID=6313 RepID=A0A0K0DGX5_ANGCA